VVIFELKVAQSPDARYPFVSAVEVGCEIVHVAEEEEILILASPDVAKVSAFQIVIAPVFALTAIPVPAAVEETKLLPNEFCLLLKVFQSSEERNPACVAEEVAIVNVQAPEEEAMVRPVFPDVANDPPNQRVRFEVRSPPPTSPVPAVIEVDEEKK